MKRIVLVLLAVLLLGSIGFFTCGQQVYKKFKEARGVRQATAFLAANDLANAMLSLKQILELNPKNLKACELMAEVLEASGSPSVIDWRLRIVEIAPIIPNRLSLAHCALRYQRPPYPITAQTLRDLEPSARDLPAFHNLSAELALKLNRFQDAGWHFQEAARLEPWNELHRLNLDVLSLQSTNSTVAATARCDLEALSCHTKLGPLALRWLVADNLRRNDLAGAECFSDRLVTLPGASFADRLQQLTILKQLVSSHEVFAEKLEALETSAAGNVAEVRALCDWMGSRGLADEALKWLAGLDPNVRRSQPLELATANLYLAKGDWIVLETFLEPKKWAELEFLRMAILARAAWGRIHGVEAANRWRGSLRAAEGRLSSLCLLLSLAHECGQDAEEVLWRIARRFPREQWAFRDLQARYFASGNTRGLNTVYASLTAAKETEGDWTNRNNFAGTCLLLGTSLAQAHAIARELYQQRPDDVIVAATYAYSQHLQARTREGLTVLGGFRPEALDEPGVALYYGVLLAAAGEADRAAKYLEIAEKINLLPEERQLLAEARRSRARE